MTMIKLFSLLMFFNSFFLQSINDCSAIEEIFKSKKVLSYLHPELKERSALYLVNNNLCKFNKKIGRLTIFTVDEKTALTNKNYLKITSIKNTKKGKIVNLSYPIEGACFIIQFDSKDKIINVEITEI